MQNNYMKLQIDIEKLQRIIEAARAAKQRDSSLSDTMEIKVTTLTDTHLGSDTVGVILKSRYGECIGQAIFWR